MNNTPKVSVIIPSFDGSRNGNVGILKSQLDSQSLKPYEVIVVVGVSPNGKSRNEGVKKASGAYYVFIDDDVTLGNDKVLENLIKPFIERDDVGLSGPSQLIPENSNWFQKKSAEQIPRSIFSVQSELTDSDMVSHMCLAIPAEFFKKIGQENPDIIAGTDPDLRYRVRKAGYRVCVVPNTWAYHPMPETFSKLMKVSFQKGRNSAVVRKQFPDLIFELDEGFRKDFPGKRLLVYRIFRSLMKLLKYLISWQFIGFVALIAYNIGNIYGTLKTKNHQ